MAHKTSGINFGKRKQLAQTDTELLVEIKQHLLQKYKIVARREWYMGFNNIGTVDFWSETVLKKKALEYRDRIRCPDLSFVHKQFGMFVIEVDGAIHDVKVEKTRQRDNQYILAGIKLIVINLSDLKEYKMSIEDYLDRCLEPWKLLNI